MKDELIDLLRERFAGHELEVPKSAWANVSGQLAAGTSGEGLREALQDKFHGHEMDVDPGMWANISTQLNPGAAAGTAASAGWIAAGVVAVGIAAGLILWNTSGKPTPVVEKALPPTTVTAQVAPKNPTIPTIAIPEQPAENHAAINTTGHAERLAHSAPAPVKHAAAPTQPAVNKQAVSSPSGPVNTVVPAAVSPQASAAPSPVQPAIKPETAPTTNHAKAPAHHSNAPARTTPAPKAEVPDEPAGVKDGRSEPASEKPVIPDPFQQEDEAANVMIPNTFTPNGDGTNDVWRVVAPDCAKFEVIIGSPKTGQVVFHSTNLNEGWDGRLPDGLAASEGDYPYVVKITEHNGHVLKPKKGVLRLFR